MPNSNSRRATWLFICVLAWLPSAAPAAGPVKLLGLDDMSCGAWKKTTDPDLRQSYLQWVRGFLSGHNYARQAEQVAEISQDTVATFVTRYCQEHASATVAEAAMRMSDQYSGRNAPITR